MTAADFRRIALGLKGVEEYSHAGLPAFRVEGRTFASLASRAAGSVCGGGARHFLGDSWRLGKNGTHAHSPGGRERRCADGRTQNSVKAANWEERKDQWEEA